MTDSFVPYEGACTCGEVRYSMISKPMFVHCCHCRWCQRETGASYALNAMIETDQVQLLEGEVEITEVPTPSGKGQQMASCPKCNVVLWSHYLGAGDAIAFVRVGTLKEPDRIQPDIQIFTDSKQPWVVLSRDIPAVPEYYRASDYWSEESLARRAKLKKQVNR